MTDKIAPPIINQMVASGKSGCRTPTAWAAMAPAAVWINPAKPAALPMALASLDKIAEVALGRVMPLPRATSPMGMKNRAGVRLPVIPVMNGMTVARVAITRPRVIILPVPRVQIGRASGRERVFRAV